MLVVTDAVVGVGDMGSKDKFFLAPFRNWETNKKQLSSVKNLTAGSCKCPSWIVIEGSLDVKLPTIWTDEK
jgi:hypothetical protein